MEKKENEQKILYKDLPEWKDVTPLPLPQVEGDAFYINYTPEYVDLFGYFLALVEKNEISERGIQIAERVIELYPSHYTAWEYKFRILGKLSYDFDNEIRKIDTILEGSPKSYQAWHFRQWLVDKCNEVPDQIPFLKKILDIDTKNFHAWNFAIWYATRWNKANDIYNIAKAEIERDVRNNSAWNARMTIGNLIHVDPIQEFEDAVSTLKIVSKNEAVCNFAVAICEKVPSLLSRLRDVANEIIERKPENYFAYRLLLYVASKEENKEEISRLCDKLMELDPVRLPFYSLVKSGKIKYQ
ncbi:protein prenylyltransferase [Histomonas meleagridis]|uniref:protein prenylyltransferase n=1 Tax=Histomonas meleagridis TaxID=135588 RepID=UPI00355A8135|nr:protein prenylyltransferase [Histomonas meleagridis]KAH0805516.1 protein prenylyltransferase [Histomonas meleagridis]